MKRRIFMVLAIAIVSSLALPVFLPTLSVVHAETTAQDKAIAMIDELGQRAVKLLSDANLDQLAKREGFNDLVSHHFDMPLIGKFALGKYWRRASDEQKTEYLELFQHYMVTTYQKRIGDYAGENLKIQDAKLLKKQQVLVKSQIIRPKGPPIQLDWRVRKMESGDQKIIDIVVENVSMLATTIQLR